jgi:hypothetical protein
VFPFSLSLSLSQTGPPIARSRIFWRPDPDADRESTKRPPWGCNALFFFKCAEILFGIVFTHTKTEKKKQKETRSRARARALERLLISVLDVGF